MWLSVAVFLGCEIVKVDKLNIKGVIDIPRKKGFVNGRRNNLRKGVCELYIKIYLPIKFHADIFCSNWPKGPWVAHVRKRSQWSHLQRTTNVVHQISSF